MPRWLESRAGSGRAPRSAHGGVPRLLAAALLVGAVCTAVCTVPVAAQDDPPRPPLPAGSDPRHWEPYFDLGVRIFRQTPAGAYEAFTWANRFDPTRAEPYFARYAAFFAKAKPEDVGAYFRGDESILRRPDILAADSMRLRALMRNPFVHRGLEILIFDRMPGSIADDRDTRAWIAYSNGEFPRAIDLLTRAIERGRGDVRWRRFDRAIAYVAMGDYRQALADIRTLVDELRAEDERGALRFYRSKHFLLYMIGMLHTQLRDHAAARTAFQEALVEDAAFAYANAGLAALSRIQRNNAQAADEYALAVQLAPDDGVLHQWYAQVLLDLNRFDEAEREVQAAIVREPWWPAPHDLLGRLREKQGRPDLALEAFARYVELAPAADARARALKPRVDARRAPAP